MLPTIEISPAGAGTATQQQAFAWNGAGDGNSHTFSSPNDSFTLNLSTSANYQIDAYRLTAQAASGYTFQRFEITYDTDESGSPVTGGNTYTSGYVDTVKAEKEREGHPGTFFSRLIGDYSETSGSYSYSYNVTSIKAVFVQSTPPTTSYTVNANASPSNGGTVQVGTAASGATSSQTVESGGSINIVATPASGYAFKGWYQNGAQISTSATYTVSNVTADQSFEARFVQVFHVQVVAFKSQAYVSLNGSPGDDVQSIWTVAEGDFEYGASITIAATSKNATLAPFKAWYRDPYAWGNPEYTGTLVPGAGATYTTTVTASVVYFATFDYLGMIVEVETFSESGPDRKAPDAIVSINGQSDGDNDYTLEVLKGSTVVLGATAYGGLEDPQAWPLPMYFVGWVDPADVYTILSESLQYTVQTSQSDNRKTYLARYETHYTLNTSVRPTASAGTVSLSPLSRYGNNLYPEHSDVTLTAASNPGWKFKHWIKKDRWSEEVVSSATTYAVEITYDLYYDTVYIAVFEWDGTDLLVNSSNLGSPVQLVYDDRSDGTGLLIADY